MSTNPTTFDDITLQDVEDPKAVYIRPIVGPDGKATFVVRDKDGTALGATPDYQQAIAAVEMNDRVLMTLH